MTSVSYDEIFSQFLGMVEDNVFWTASKDDATELLTEYLHKSVYDSYVYNLFSSLSTEDPTQMLTFEMKFPVNEVADKHFVTIALAKYMKYEWAERQLNSVSLTAFMIGGKESKFYSQSKFASELQALTDSAYKEARDFIRDRGYINNSYLSGAKI